MSTSKIGQILKGGPSNWGKWGKDDEVGAVKYLDRRRYCVVSARWSTACFHTWYPSEQPHDRRSGRARTLRAATLHATR